MSQYVLPLDTAESSLEVLGGKGRSLARLATAGLSVPGGFQLTTTAYKGFVADNKLQAMILEFAKPELKNDRVSFESASERIQKLFEGVDLSAEVVAEIREAYAALDGDDPPVAVRSSANAEDLPDMSFAGQQDTYLNVRGEEALRGHGRRRTTDGALGCFGDPFHGQSRHGRAVGDHHQRELRAG
jgi:pyruvate,water dikinase